MADPRVALAARESNAGLGPARFTRTSGLRGSAGGFFDPFLEGVCVPDIEASESCLSAALLDPRDSLPTALAVDVRDDHVPAFLGAAFGDRASDARPGAGDEYLFSVESPTSPTDAADLNVGRPPSTIVLLSGSFSASSRRR